MQPDRLGVSDLLLGTIWETDATEDMMLAKGTRGGGSRGGGSKGGSSKGGSGSKGGKGPAGWPSTTGNPSGGGRDNAPSKK